MTVLLSLIAAATYGFSDFVGGTAARRTTAWSVAFVSQLGGLVGALVALAFHHGSPTGGDLAWAALAGVGNGVGTAFLYRGLGGGRMGVVGPVSGVGAAVVPVLVGVASGERPGALAWAGVVIALPAIGLVSSEPRGESATRPSRAALVDGVLAGLGFGGLFAALAQLRPDAGPGPFALNSVVGAVAVVVLAQCWGQTWWPRHPASGLGAVSGVLGVSATLLFSAATRHGYLAVAAVVTSLYPAVTVVLAAAVLHERVHRWQGAGLALCALSVALAAV